MKELSHQNDEHNQQVCSLFPGTIVERSGIYEICHADEPRVTVLLTRDSIFPYCRRCDDRVRYRLIQAAPHISEDSDFCEDPVQPDNSPQKVVFPIGTLPLQLGVSHGFRFSQDALHARRESSDFGDIPGPASPAS